MSSAVDQTRRMHGTYDKTADAAYLYLTEEIQPGESRRQAVVEAEGLSAMVVLDFDHRDHLIGIEIVGARGLLRPETIDRLDRL